MNTLVVPALAISAMALMAAPVIGRIRNMYVRRIMERGGPESLNEFIIVLEYGAESERQQVAKALAQSKIEGSVATLIRMADGQIANSLDNQLLAIECLGDSGSCEALKFLEKIHTPKVETSDSGGYYTGYGNDAHHVYYDDYKYLNAAGNLKSALDFSLPRSNAWGHDVDESTFNQMLAEHFAGPPHQVIQKAIDKLRAQCGGVVTENN
jgi:hypothetical protein